MFTQTCADQRYNKNSKVKVSFSSIFKVEKFDQSDLDISLIIFTLGDGPVVLTGPGYHGVWVGFNRTAQPEVGPYLDPHLLLFQGHGGRICGVGRYNSIRLIRPGRFGCLM